MLINCWLRKLILFYFYQVWCWEKVDNLQKFCSRSNKIFVGTLIFLVFFSKSGIQYFWQGKISVCKLPVPIEIVQMKNNYFRHPKFESHTIQEMNGFLYCRCQRLIQAVFDIGILMYSLFGLLNDNIESPLRSNLVS